MIPPFPSHHIPCSQGGNWYPDDETVDPFILRSDQAWISSPNIHNYYIISHSQSWKVYEMSILFCCLPKCHNNWKLNVLVDICQKSQKKRTQPHILPYCALPTELQYQAYWELVIMLVCYEPCLSNHLIFRSKIILDEWQTVRRITM